MQCGRRSSCSPVLLGCPAQPLIPLQLVDHQVSQAPHQILCDAQILDNRTKISHAHPSWSSQQRLLPQWTGCSPQQRPAHRSGPLTA